MRLSEFMVLPQEQKRSTVVKEGIPVAKKESPEEMLFLFQLPGFYVETRFSKQSKEIREYRMFHHSELLVTLNLTASKYHSTF